MIVTDHTLGKHGLRKAIRPSMATNLGRTCICDLIDSDGAVVARAEGFGEHDATELAFEMYQHHHGERDELTAKIDRLKQEIAQTGAPA